MDEAARRELEDVVARALAEDVGDGDRTSLATVPHEARAVARITQKQAGVLFGLDAAECVLRSVEPDVEIVSEAEEGVWRDGGPVLTVTGTARGLLAAERTALNLLQRLSGVATLAARYVAAVEGTGAKILDTRKTTPGLRLLEKAAVRAGGAVNHRIGLWDEILIKENHAYLAGGVGEAVRRARAAAPELPLEVECRSVADIDEALAAGAPRLLLDNMTPDELRAAVAHVAGRAVLEASGGIDLERVRAVAQTGVQFVSVGAITHSAPALDLSLILEPLP
ncbi:MAG: carboxylating nicotinate-nucleotide diphosphorylase [Actinobacteria bacterium]|nr:carboxylating nicotinate-nucleotide diphosphorylase [Actinomycetota bacterium]